MYDRKLHFGFRGSAGRAFAWYTCNRGSIWSRPNSVLGPSRSTNTSWLRGPGISGPKSKPRLGRPNGVGFAAVPGTGMYSINSRQPLAAAAMRTGPTQGGTIGLWELESREFGLQVKVFMVCAKAVRVHMAAPMLKPSWGSTEKLFIWNTGEAATFFQKKSKNDLDPIPLSLLTSRQPDPSVWPDFRYWALERGKPQQNLVPRVKGLHFRTGWLFNRKRHPGHHYRGMRWSG